MESKQFRKNRSLGKILLFTCLVTGGVFFSCSQLGLSWERQSQGEETAKSTDDSDSLPDLDRMTGVNWFGFETDIYVPHGLWVRDYKSMLQQMKDLGFNTVRLPFSNEMLDQTPSEGIQINSYGVDDYTGETGLNVELEGLTSLEIMDAIIEEAGNQGLRIVLDCHSREADGYYEETLWYTDDFSEEEWIEDWEMLAERYKDTDNVVAYDINNEPHGGYIVEGMTPAATWGFDLEEYGDTNWKEAAEKCAQAILDIDPDIFIVIQGVQDYEGSNYWWGSNHAGLNDYPITDLPTNRVIYSVHEYGPEVSSQDWFDDEDFPDNLPSVWEEAFWFIYEEDLGGLYIGEIGITEDSASDTSCVAYQWLTTFLEYAGDKVHFTVWSWNPNSGDTGGILQDDWVSVEEEKYSLFQPYLEDSEESDSDDSDSDEGDSDDEDEEESSDGADETEEVLDVSLLYADGSTGSTSNTIIPRLTIENNGTASLDLSEVSLRYYYTSESEGTESACCDHGGASVDGVYTDLTSTVEFSDTVMEDSSLYWEITFSDEAPELSEGEEVSIQFRITNSLWEDYDQSDDYSYSSTEGEWEDSTVIPLYVGEELAYGELP
ncbi:MAG: cellulase family glycosylhydrolase [Spirochaetales bacterium]|nr:cellulase family glycosylhydrolase [Spirochaetales bacterium]